MSYKPGSVFYQEFTTRRFDTGVKTNADALPTGVMVRNGADDVAVTVTVVNKSAGDYSMSATIPSNYAAGDTVWIRVAATVNGVSDNTISAAYILDTARPGEVYSRLGTPVGASLSADLALKASQSSVTDANASIAAVGSNVSEVRTDTENLQSRLPTGLSGGRMASEAQAVTDKSGYNLVVAPPTTAQIAAAVEASLLNEGDGQMLINAIVGAIGNQNVDQAILVAAIRADLERGAGNLQTLITNLATKASQASLDAVALKTALIPAAGLPSLADYTSLRAAKLDNLDTTISSRLLGTQYVIPDNAGITAIKTVTDELDPLIQAGAFTVAALVNAPSGDNRVGSNAVVIAVERTSSFLRLAGVLVTVFGSDGSTRIDQQRTNGLGTVTFALENGSYFITLNPITGYSGSALTPLTVAANPTLLTLFMNPLDFNEPAPVATRRIDFYVKDLQGNPRADIEVSASLTSDFSAYDGALVLNIISEARTDQNGYAFLYLATLGTFIQGDGQYLISVEGGPAVKRVIPDGAGPISFFLTLLRG